MRPIRFVLTGLGLLLLLIGAVTLFQSSLTVDLISVQNAPRTQGSTRAPVQIVEYSNFACPSCRAARLQFHQLQELFPGKLYYSFRHFPQVSNERSVHAHIAAECAAEQGRFWAMHERLFEDQPSWKSEVTQSRKLFMQYAQTAGLEMDRFEACLQDQSIFQRIYNEWVQGQALGVTHTPTYFIQDKIFVGPRQFEEGAEEWIRKLLSEQSTR